MAKKRSNRMPKPDAPPEEKKGPDDPTPEDRARMEAAILGDAAPKRDAGDELDLDAPADPAAPKDPNAQPVDKPSTIGPWRAKLMAPLVTKYMIGLQKMLSNKMLRKKEEFHGYAEGLTLCTEATLGAADILLRKYLEIIPYVEEGFFVTAGLTTWQGTKYLNARLDADDAARARGGGENNNPPAPTGS